MRIGELAAMAGVTTSALRFYERIGLIPEPIRTPSGYRDYPEEVAHRLDFIQSSQRIGLTLSEIGQVAAYRDEGSAPCVHVLDLLHKHERQIEARIAELNALRVDLKRLLERGRALEPEHCRPEDVCHVVPSPRRAR